jgi:hypothetical protein
MADITCTKPGDWPREFGMRCTSSSLGKWLMLLNPLCALIATHWIKSYDRICQLEVLTFAK